MHTNPHDSLSLRALIPFALITFGIAWGILALYIFLPGPTSHWFGELTGNHPLFYLAVYAPAIAALCLVARRCGVAAVPRFLSRLLLWRCSWAWWGFLLVIVPLPFFLGAVLGGTLPEDFFPYASLPAYGSALFLMAIKGPVEELGWRGFALPLLQRHLAPLWASLLLGVVWGLWHFPAFLLSGVPQGAWSYMPFFIGSVALSVLVTPLFNQSRGSLLLPAIFHFQLINPLWPEAQPYDTVLFVILAVLIVWHHRATMFVRTTTAVTEVLPDE